MEKSKKGGFHKPRVFTEKEKEKYIQELNEREGLFDSSDVSSFLAHSVGLLDVKFGYSRLGDSNVGEKRVGFLFNVKPVRTNELY
jgi:hypothetical protein